MSRVVIVLLLLSVMSCSAFAGLRARPHELRQIANPSMVVVDRGAKLEILPDERALPHLNSARRGILHHVVRANRSAPIGPRSLGVVFNYSMQQQGYISGEISFKVRGSGTFKGDGNAYPGLRRVIKPNVYVVKARSIAEFISVLKSLQSRTDLEWVVPTVIYGPAD